MLLNFLLFHFLLLGSKKCNIWDSLFRPFLFNTFLRTFLREKTFPNLYLGILRKIYGLVQSQAYITYSLRTSNYFLLNELPT